RAPDGFPIEGFWTVRSMVVQLFRRYSTKLGRSRGWLQCPNPGSHAIGRSANRHGSDERRTAMFEHFGQPLFSISQHSPSAQVLNRELSSEAAFRQAGG